MQSGKISRRRARNAKRIINTKNGLRPPQGRTFWGHFVAKTPKFSPSAKPPNKCVSLIGGGSYRGGFLTYTPLITDNCFCRKIILRKPLGEVINYCKQGHRQCLGRRDWQSSVQNLAKILLIRMCKISHAFAIWMYRGKSLKWVGPLKVLNYSSPNKVWDPNFDPP